MPTEARRVLPSREGRAAGAARRRGVSSNGLGTARRGSLTCSPGTLARSAAARSQLGARLGPGACAAAALSGGGAGSVCKERGA